MNRTEWYERLEKLCTYDVRKMFDRCGHLLAIKDMPESERLAIADFEVVEHYAEKGEHRKLVGVTKKIKLVDRLKPLELLGKAKGWFREHASDEHKIPKCVEVVFVDAKGAQCHSPRRSLDFR